MEQDTTTYYVRQGHTWQRVTAAEGYDASVPLTWDAAVIVAAGQAGATGEPFHIVPVGEAGAVGLCKRTDDGTVELHDLRGREWDNPLISRPAVAG